MRPDFLKKISKIASYDWAAKGFPISKEHFADANLWNSVNLSGRREGPLYVEEPNFVLVKEEPHSELLGIYWATFIHEDVGHKITLLLQIRFIETTHLFHREEGKAKINRNLPILLTGY